MTDADRKELEHIGGGGTWCLDGRKERRLMRLGLIMVPNGGRGYVLTDEGRATLTQLEPEG